MQNNYITAAQLAQANGISRQMVYYYKNRGDLPEPMSIGGVLVWDGSMLDNWVVPGNRAGRPPKEK